MSLVSEDWNEFFNYGKHPQTHLVRRSFFLTKNEINMLCKTKCFQFHLSSGENDNLLMPQTWGLMARKGEYWLEEFNVGTLKFQVRDI